MSYEEVIRHLGDFGRYQRQIYFLLCVPAISCAFHKLAGVFLLARPDFRCRLPFEDTTTTGSSSPVLYNVSYDSWPLELWTYSYPFNNNTGQWQTCQYYDRRVYNESLLRQLLAIELAANNSASSFLAFIEEFQTAAFNGNTSSSSSTPPEDYNHLKNCESYIYDRKQYERTAVSEWNMVCSRSLLSATSDSLFMVGVLLGSLLFGQLSDRCGRKPTFFASLVLQVVFGVLGGVAPNYLSYTVARVIVGATTSGVFLVAYVIAMEMVGVSYRLFAGIVCQMFFSVGFMLTAAFAYFIRDWRRLQIALSLPGLLFMCYHWIIPESARWLLSKGRKDDAITVIEKAARVNNVTIPREVYENLLEEPGGNRVEENDSNHKPKEPTLMDLLKHPNLRRKTLLIFFDWFVNSGTYYGLSWSTNNLGGNVLLNFVISGAVEIPAYSFLLLTLNRWGRRTILCSCMFAAGIALICTTAVPTHMNWLIVSLAMFGKLAITASYGTVYIFSAEQFPTVVRNVGLGAASMMGRFGGILAPYLNLLGQLWRPLPLVVCGIGALIGSICSVTLPETLNRPMLESIEDGEQFGSAMAEAAVSASSPNEEEELSPMVAIRRSTTQSTTDHN